MQWRSDQGSGSLRKCFYRGTGFCGVMGLWQPAWHHFCLLLAYAPLFTHLFTHPLYSAPYSASPLHLLTPIIPLTNPLQIADQFLIKHLVNFIYKAIGPPLYKPAAKGCKSVSSWPSIYILILSVTAYPPLLSLNLQVTSAGLKSSFFKLSRLSSIWRFP